MPNLRRLQFSLFGPSQWLPIIIDPSIAWDGRVESPFPIETLVYNPLLRAQRSSGNRPVQDSSDFNVPSFNVYPSICERKGSYCAYASICCSAYCFKGICS